MHDQRQSRLQRILLQYCLCFLLLCIGLPAMATATYLPLGSNVQVPRLSIELDTEDWQWLASNRELRVGIFSPDFAPFQFTYSGAFAGINADYLKIISYNLGLTPVIVLYPDRESALQALRDGAVDIVDDVDGAPLGGAGLLASEPYIVNPAVLVTRRGAATLPQDFGGLRVAVNPRKLLAPGQRQTGSWVNLATPLLGLSAVAYGQADVYLGDPLSVAYYMAAGIFEDIELQKRDQLGSIGGMYTLRHSSGRLRHILNQAIASIPDVWRQNVLYRWGLPTASFRAVSRLRLTEREKRWLQRQHEVRVVTLNVFPPFSMYNRNASRPSGMSIDLLQRLSDLTGLRFVYQGVDTAAEMQQALVSGAADMGAGMFWSAARDASLDFSTPYLTSAVVLVGRRGDPALSADATYAGRRIATVTGSSSLAQLRDHYPLAKVVPVASPNEALLAVLDGRADMAIQSQLAANFYLRNYFRDELEILAAFNIAPARLAFAFGRQQDELQSIINKALALLPADEQIYVLNRWRAQAPPQINTWYAYRTEIYLLIGLAFASALIFLAWIFYLRLQIRKRRRAERALNDQLAFMHVLLDGIPYPVFVRDLEGRMVLCNRSYLQAFNVAEAEVLGRKITESPSAEQQAEQAAQVHQQYLDVMHGSQGAVFQDMEIDIDGRKRYLYHWMLPYTDSLGHVAGMIGGWTDLTERTELLHQLQEAKEDADAASRAKTTFLATMSHEIRTPMNAIIGMLELVLRREPDPVADRDALQVAYDSARSLLALIGDILDISKIEAEKFELSPRPASLRQVAENLINVFQGLARQRNLTLALHREQSDEQDVEIDAARLKQVLANLISNALKFTEHGGVTLTLRQRRLDSGLAQIELMVDDTGPGINAADRRKLFEPFTQIRPAGDEEQHISGTGLGLAISRRIIDAMGGNLDLSSIPGKGTRIEITLTAPLLACSSYGASAAEATPREGASRRLKVLVIDDHSPNRMLLSQQLAFIGHDVQEAADGRQGLAAWQAQPFDVVLTDCNMPGMSGYALAREIRRLEAEQGRARTVILAVTASAQPEEVERCRQAGMDGCLFKPLGVDTLRDRLAGLAPAGPACAPPIRKESATAVGPLCFAPQQLHQLTQGDAALTQRIVQALIETNREDADALRQALENRDHALLAGHAHRIAGGARVVGAEATLQAARKLEDAAPDCDDAQAAALTARLLEDLAQLEQALQDWLAGAGPQAPPA